MAKYVHPNMIVDSSVSFLKNVTFDSSVYLQGVTHISSPAAASSGTPYALVVDSIGADVQIKNIQLGTMAFETSTNYYGKTEVDGLISDLSTLIDTRLDNIDSSILDLDLLTQQFTTDINDVSLRVEDIEASLGDYVRKDGDTMSGVLVLNSGFTLDSETITAIDTSADGLGQLDTAIPTSGAVSKAIAAAIFAGVTADNGLKEQPDGNIQLGGPLTRDTSIDTTGFDLSLIGLETGTSLKAVILTGDVLETQQLGTMALEASANYYYATQVDTLVSDLSILLDTRIDLIDAEIAQLDASIVRIDASLNDVIDIFDVIDASFAAVWTAIDNLESSVGGLDLLTQQHTSDINDVSVRVQSLENAAVDSWNGLTTSSDGSIGLGGTLAIATTITTSDTSTLSIAGLVTSTDETPFAMVQDSAGGPIKTRELGTMAWATATDYVLQSLFDTSIAAIWTKFGYVDNSIAGLDTLTQTHTSQIAQLTTDIADVSSRVETAEGDISNLETSVYTVLNSWNLSQDASIVDLRNTSLSALQTANNGLTASDTSVILGGTLTHDTNIDTDQYYLSVTGDMRVIGDLTVDGSVTYINSVNLNVSDNIITINYGETGDGVTRTNAGLIIDRGSSTNYFFGFSEDTDTFRIGMQDEETGLPTGTQAVATREDTPEGFGIPFWNGSLYRFDTSSGFEFTPGVGLSLPIATNDPSEATALMIDGTGLVVSRDLGTMAFATATDYVLQSLFDSSVAAIWTKFGSVDTSIAGLDTLTQTHTSQIAQITTDIADLSTGKLDAVATVTGITSGHEVFSNEADNVAYIKRIVAGTGVSMISDSSTITISADLTSGVLKYQGTFDGTAGTSFSILEAEHHLGIGPLSVTVYDGTDQVWVDVDCAANGDITLEWTDGALSASCKYIIMG